MSDTHAQLRCPSCQAVMQTGFLPTSQGMHFIRGDGRSASHFAEGLPGTHAIMRTNKLLAWRCKACEVVVFRYGRDNARTIERLLDDGAISEQELEEQLRTLDENEKA